MMSKFNPNNNQNPQSHHHHRLMMNPAFFQSSTTQTPSVSSSVRDIPIEIVESRRSSTATTASTSAQMRASSYREPISSSQAHTSHRSQQGRNNHHAVHQQQQQPLNIPSSSSRMIGSLKRRPSSASSSIQNAIDEDEENVISEEEEEPSSLYEMTRYLNKKNSTNNESIHHEEDENFVVQNTKLFKPVVKQSMKNDFDEIPIHAKYNQHQEMHDVEEQDETLDQDDDTPTSIHESPIKARQPPRSGAKHRRTLSSRILPSNNFNQRRDNDSSSDSASPPQLPPQSRQYRSPVVEETKVQEDSPNVNDKKPLRKQARYPKKLLEKPTHEIVEDEQEHIEENNNLVFSNDQEDSEEHEYKSQKQTLSRNRSAPSSSSLKEMKRLQEENLRLQGEINELKRDKNEMIKLHNDKIHSLTDRHNLEIQSQQQRMEKILDEKDSKITELQRENERLKSEIGLLDKSKDGQDTNKLLQELEQRGNLFNNLNMKN
ncbi:hypothetical protein FDP41_013780 [Naegleria fowleri]|uniref:Uncharacterized protein n=1 Tax=Naegleria fowleri TaxID=5763 RepID=A0A6A5BZU9_NAEFO|nr:uncharacterized protein FDP41_013780 [Naegleria fowleri]KAF0980131.1 hypothetical protein FDP41_013780 [Naegleria fowleri]